MPRPVSEQVVVITGASSGIGREAALEFGKRGAAVVLAARNEVALRAVADEVGRLGGRALAIVTDVAEWDQVERLARQAVERFGRIDTWVNNAAVSAYGTAEQLTVEEIERILRVNLMGQIHGIKAVLPRMKQQGEGTIINVGSVESERALPLQSAYAASKHGVKGFTEALRMELAHEGSGIHVTLILPASINTPLFTHARSKMGVKPLPLPPIYEPGIVAEAILYAAEHPKRDIIVGGSGAMISAMQRISPSLTDWYMLQGGRAFKKQQTDQPDDGRDNLFGPLNGPGSSVGEFGDLSKSTSLYTRTFELHPGLTWALLGGVAVGAALVLGGQGRRKTGGIFGSAVRQIW